jgi:hypothetical protein
MKNKYKKKFWIKMDIQNRPVFERPTAMLLEVTYIDKYGRRWKWGKKDGKI